MKNENRINLENTNIGTIKVIAILICAITTTVAILTFGYDLKTSIAKNNEMAVEAKKKADEVVAKCMSEINARDRKTTENLKTFSSYSSDNRKKIFSVFGQCCTEEQKLNIMRETPESGINIVD